MAKTGDLRVSNRGQMSLPSGPRRRWGLQDGGDVAYLDLGDAMLLLPGRIADVRAELLASITDAVQAVDGLVEKLHSNNH